MKLTAARGGNTRSPDQTGQSVLTDVPILFPSMDRQSYRPPTPSPAISTVLFELFRYRVDTVYKVVHLPTTLASIKSARSNSKLTVPGLALEYALYFTALCTITDDEADAMGLGSRTELLGSYRNAVEHFLGTSALLDHPDLTALQAFIIYLVSSGLS